MLKYNFIKTNRVTITISVLILIFLYWQIDFISFIDVLMNIDIIFLFIGLLMLVPITMFTAIRLVWLSPDDNRINYIEALQLTLAASVMNLVLPSKMGDIVKSVFMVKNSDKSIEKNLSLVIFEKISDFLSLLLWCILGLFLYQDNNWLFVIFLTSLFLLGLLSITSYSFVKLFFGLVLLLLPSRYAKLANKLQHEWLRMVFNFQKQKKKFVFIQFFSIFLWFLHLLQLWIFILSLGSLLPFLINLAITPLAIFIGLLPLSFAGIGTRDLAFVYFYSSYLSATTAAGLGILATLRYIVPALFGIPFFIKYMKLKFIKNL